MLQVTIHMQYIVILGNQQKNCCTITLTHKDNKLGQVDEAVKYCDEIKHKIIYGVLKKRIKNCVSKLVLLVSEIIEISTLLLFW